MIVTTKKFRSYDQKIIYNVLQKALQIKGKIEEQAYETQTNPADLPQSLLPTDVLYDICSCLTAMYEKLEAKELIDSGYPKQDNTQLH